MGRKCSPSGDSPQSDSKKASRASRSAASIAAGLRGGTGLYYYRARYYHPTFGRFVSEDPLGFAAGDTNLYAYVGNFLVNLTDPSGMIAPLAAACIGGGLLDAGVYVGMETLGGRKVTVGGALGAAAIGCGGSLVGFGLGKVASKAMGRLAPAAAAAADDVVVLGKYPDYINLADDLGARRFNVPDWVWNGMSDAERWATNQRFLDRAIARGSDIRLASRASPSNLTGYFEPEI